MATPLYFIQPHVIERLRSGQFVAKRGQTKAYPLRDRRDVLSPMNVTRRAIAYEPLVFSNHREEIQACAEALNQFQTRVALISGPSGRGKTSFVRGLVEMVGGVDAYTGYTAQLLWFDVSRHTDSDEIIRFLVDYLTHVCETEKRLHEPPPTPFLTQKSGRFQPLDKPSPFVQEKLPPLATAPVPAERAAEQSNQIAALTSLLNNMSRMPILIIIDNVEHLTTPGHGFRSPELKEAFQFLMTFANVKLVLSGRSLPTKDFPQQAYQFTVPALSTEESLALVAHDLINTDPKRVAHLVPYFKGEPALLRVFASLYPYHPQPSEWEALLAANPPQEALWQVVCNKLSGEEKNVFDLLSLVRHGLSRECIETIAHACIPGAGDFQWKMLHGLWIKMLLKKVYPPQMVLARLHQRAVSDHGDPIDAYYQMQDMFHDPVGRTLSVEDACEMHKQLHAFYIAEKDKHLPERIYMVRTRHLAHEAQYHLSMAKKYERILAQSKITTEPETYAPEPSGGGEYPLTGRINSDMISPDMPVAMDSVNAMPMWDETPSTMQVSAMPFVVPIQPVIQMAPAMTAPVSSVEISMPQFSEEPVLKLQPEVNSASPKPEEIPEDSPVYEKALAVFKQGHEAFVHYQHNDALRLLNETVYLLETESSGDAQRKILAQAYFDLAEVAAFREDYDTAISHYQKSLVYHPYDPAFQATSWFQMAIVHENQNCRQDALTAYHCSADACAKSGLPALMANACYNMARLYEEDSQPQKALEAIQQTLLLDKHLDNKTDLSRSLRVKARICKMLGRTKEALQAAKDALVHIQKTGSLFETVECQILLASLCETSRHWQEALSWYHEAERIGQMVLSPKSLADIQESVNRVGALLNDTSPHTARKSTV